MVFTGKNLVRPKNDKAINDITIEQISHFQFLRIYITYENNSYLDNKITNLTQFVIMSFSCLYVLCPYIEKQEKRPDKFYNIMAVFTVFYYSENWIRTQKRFK